jgi:prophage tail gpP-like protein
MISMVYDTGAAKTTVGGLLSYNVEKTLFKDCDPFSCVSDNPGGIYSSLTEPARINIYDADTLVYTGWLDGVDNVGSPDTKQIGWAGRDLMGPVTESDASPANYNNITLDMFLKKRLAPFGLTSFSVEDTTPRKKVIVARHESEFEACLRVAREFQKHLWIAADGTVTAQGIAYADDPSYTFKRLKDGEKAGNGIIPVLSGKQALKFEKLLSEVHVRYGQHNSAETVQTDADLLKLGLLRRRWRDLCEIKDKSTAGRRAVEMIQESKVGSRDIVYTVEREYFTGIELNTVATVDDWYLKISGEQFLVAGLAWRKSVEQGSSLEVTLRPVGDAVKVMPKLLRTNKKGVTTVDKRS